MIALLLFALPCVRALLLEVCHVLRVELVEVELVKLSHDSEARAIKEEVKHLVILDVLLL